MTYEVTTAPEQTEPPRIPLALTWILSGALVLLLIVSGYPLLFAWAFVGVGLIFVGPAAGIVLMICTAVKRSRGVSSPAEPAVPSGELVGVPGAASSGRVRRPVNERTAENAAHFRLWRQTSLFVAHVVLIAVLPLGVAFLAGFRDDTGALVFILLTMAASLGLLVLFTAPWWMLGPSSFAGEQRSIVSRTGAWRLIRVHRILAWIVGVAYSLTGLVLLMLFLGNSITDMIPSSY